MYMRKTYLFFSAMLIALSSFAQTKPEETEYYSPVPPIVTPGANFSTAPSDAIILFDGKNLDEWVATKDTAAGKKWNVADGIITVDKTAGDIHTKRRFMDFQLHIEY